MNKEIKLNQEGQNILSSNHLNNGKIVTEDIWSRDDRAIFEYTKQRVTFANRVSDGTRMDVNGG